MGESRFPKDSEIARLKRRPQSREICDKRWKKEVQLAEEMM